MVIHASLPAAGPRASALPWLLSPETFTFAHASSRP